MAKVKRIGVESLGIAEGWFTRQECGEQVSQKVLLSLSPRRRTRARCRVRPPRSSSPAIPSLVSWGAGGHCLPSPAHPHPCGMTQQVTGRMWDILMGEHGDLKGFPAPVLPLSPAWGWCEWVGPFQTHLVQPLSHKQGHLQLGQVASSSLGCSCFNPRFTRNISVIFFLKKIMTVSREK